MNIDLGVVAPIYLAMLFILLLSGMPIMFGLGVIAVVSIFVWAGPSVAPAMAYVSWTMLASFVLAAVPLFVLMGLLMSETGFSRYIYDKINPLVSRLIPGGLLQTNIVVGAIFAAICGSSVAECATIGAVSLPEMDRRRYDSAISAGSVAAGGTLGILIPPSIIMIIYGAMTYNSIGRLFIGGIIPGLILSAGYMLYILIRVKIQPHLVPRIEPAPLGYALKEFAKIAPLALVILAVLGSIYLGVATPSEAAALGCVMMLLLPMLYRMLSWNSLKSSLVKAVTTSSMVLMITLGASLMGIFLSNTGLPKMLAAQVVAWQLSPASIFFILFAFYLILGCLMEGISMMVITLPVVYPVVIASGFDPIWFGIVMTMWEECGLLTPPVGMNLFVLQGLRPNQPFSQIVSGAMPFFLVLCAVIMLLLPFPELVLFLPRIMLGN